MATGSDPFSPTAAEEQQAPWERRPDEAAFLPPAQQAPLDLQALASHLRGCGLTLDLHSAPRQFRGGLANINYLVSIDGELLVLRRPPAGELPPGAHDMEREHRILSRLWRALPLAPRSRHLCLEAAVIGAPFHLVEYRPGLILRGGQLPDRADAAARLTEVMVETLVRLHAVKADAAGLGDLGRPEGFLARGVAGWAKRARIAAEEEETRARAGEIVHWLQGRIEAVRRRPPVLLHCDFKLDNMILEPASLSPLAVIDWDMGTRGDPLFDLATLLSYWSEPGDPACMQRLGQMPTAQGGFPSRARVAELYAEASGCDLSGLAVLRVLTLFKLGVVFLQLHQRWRAGGLGDARYKDFKAQGRELLAFARDVAEGRHF